MDYESVAKKILQRVGGKENVVSLVHCMTRLRFTLKDESIVDDEAVKKTKGVMGVMKKAGQYQIIIGNDVANVFAELNKLGNFSNEAPKKLPEKQEKKRYPLYADGYDFRYYGAGYSGDYRGSHDQGAFDTAANDRRAGYRRVYLQPAKCYGRRSLFLHACADCHLRIEEIRDKYVLCGKHCPDHAPSEFYFSDGCDANEAGEVVKFLGFIPVTYASYSYSVIPIILAVWSLQYVEKLVDKITPVVTKNFLKPMLVVLIEAPIALIVLRTPWSDLRKCSLRCGLFCS